MGNLIDRRVFPLALTLGLMAFDAAAEPSSEVAWTPETFRLVKNGDAANGQVLAEEHCAECHGESGIDEYDEVPNLAGQLDTYLYKQLVDYKSGKRANRRMRRRVRKLEASQLADLAVWYSSLSPQARGPEAPIHPLVTDGDPARMLGSCDSCHGREAEGGDLDVPTLTGQSADILVEMLEAFRDSSRTNDIYGRMRQVAEALTDDEIEALAAYYGGLPAE